MDRDELMDGDEATNLTSGEMMDVGTVEEEEEEEDTTEGLRASLLEATGVAFEGEMSAGFEGDRSADNRREKKIIEFREGGATKQPTDLGALGFASHPSSSQD